MIVIGLLSSVFGLMFMIRTIREWQDQALISKGVLTKIGTVYFAMLIASHLVFDSLVWIFVGAFIPPFGLSQAELFIHSRCRKKLCHGFFPLIQEIILLMKMGTGFRSAFHRAIGQSEDPYFRIKLSELMQSVVFSQQAIGSQQGFPSGILGFWCREFQKIDQQGHRAVERLENLRRKLQIENDFRRRSGQVLAQLHLQSILLSTLYVMLLMFVILQFGFLENWRMILLSFTLFFSGALVSYLLGGKIRWKV